MNTRTVPESRSPGVPKTQDPRPEKRDPRPKTRDPRHKGTKGQGFPAWCLVGLLAAGCRGPIRIDYEQMVGIPPRPGSEFYQEIPLRRFALSPRGSLPRQLYERLAQAVELANRFIDSPANHYFPPGWHLRAAEDGRIFMDADSGEGFRVHIYVSCWGTLISSLGFSAQERADGFSVGALQDVRNRPVDVTIANTLFFTLDGRWRSAEWMAALLLHEMSHTLQVRVQGQTSYWFEYYLRATILMQGGAQLHELEKVPYRVEREYWKWLADRS